MLINCHVENSLAPKKRKTDKKEEKQGEKFDNQAPRKLKYFGTDFSKSCLCDKIENNSKSENPKENMKSVEVTEFHDLSEKMKASLKDQMSIEFLTWIQKNSISPIKSRRHVLIKSPSGTGKTLSYAVPIVDRISEYNRKITRKDGVLVLIIVPTKELAKQTFTVFNQVLKNYHEIQAGAVYGEDKRKSEKSRIRKGINILISTPGRILDHLINTQALRVDNLQTIVIDEADLIMELGYERKFNEIITEIKNRFRMGGESSTSKLSNLQTILLSATLDSRVNSLCRNLLTDPIFIDATPSAKLSLAHQMLSCNSQLFQTVIIIPTKWRLVALIFFLFKIHACSDPFKTIIFVGNIYSVRFYMLVLRRMFEIFKGSFVKNGMDVFELHGSMEIKERMDVFSRFSTSECGVLVSTDVAARGLDFQNVKWVIQFDPARSPVDYVHRVGRTARAGNDGSSALFLLPHETEYLSLLKESGMSIGAQYDLEDLSKDWLNSSKTTSNKNNKLNKCSLEEAGSEILNKVRELVENSPGNLHLASKCFNASVKAYTSYPKNLKRFFNVKCLHIGHLAESIGLTYTPKDINKISRGEEGTTTIDKRNQKSINLNFAKDSKICKTRKPALVTPSVMTTSEYSSTCEKGPTTRKSHM